MSHVPSDSIHRPSDDDVNHSASYPPQDQTIPQLANLQSSTSTNDELVSKEQSDLQERESSSKIQGFRNKFLRASQIKWYLVTIIISGFITLMIVYQRQIIIALKPFSEDLRELKIGNFKIGWIVPIMILVIISFPPLIGHEIVVMICGLVWGLWWGFAIASIGTCLGELANFFVFRYSCRERAVNYEEKNLRFATLSLVIREGGLWIAFLARLSAMPSHLLTPIFATSGMNVWIFSAATILSSPKQFSHVYLGTLFQLRKVRPSDIEKLLAPTVFIVSSIVTIGAAVYIYWRMKKVKAVVLENRMKSQRSDGILVSDESGKVQPYDLIFPTLTSNGVEAGSTLELQENGCEKKEWNTKEQ